MEYQKVYHRVLGYGNGKKKCWQVRVNGIKVVCFQACFDRKIIAWVGVVLLAKFDVFPSYFNSVNKCI
jgi:hypothetical protein